MHPLREQLIQQGFFPTAPSQPNLTVSIPFLEFYMPLFERTGDAVMAIAAALSNFYERQGYPVVNQKVSPINSVNVSCTYMSRESLSQIPSAKHLAMQPSGMMVCAGRSTNVSRTLSKMRT